MSTSDSRNEAISMSELLHFNTGHDIINIPREIGADYWDFGVALLQCDDHYITSLENEFMRNAERINCRILQGWLDGRGKQPVTWMTLTYVLEDIERSSLANQIKR